MYILQFFFLDYPSHDLHAWLFSCTYTLSGIGCTPLYLFSVDFSKVVWVLLMYFVILGADCRSLLFSCLWQNFFPLWYKVSLMFHTKSHVLHWLMPIITILAITVISDVSNFLILKGGQLAAINLESRAALLAAKQVIIFW